MISDALFKIGNKPFKSSSSGAFYQGTANEVTAEISVPYWA